MMFAGIHPDAQAYWAGSSALRVWRRFAETAWRKSRVLVGEDVEAEKPVGGVVGYWGLRGSWQ